MSESARTYTPWDIFIWTAGTFIGIMGLFFFQIELVRSTVQDDSKDIAVIKNNTAWIIKEIKQKPNDNVSLNQ